MILSYVAIPFRGKYEMTDDIVTALYAQNEIESVILMCNGPVRDLPDGWPWPVYDCEDWNLHGMWNFAIEEAIRLAGTPVVNIGTFNNDIAIGENFISKLAAGLRSDDRLAAVSGAQPWHETEEVAVHPARAGDRFEPPTAFLKAELPFRFDDSFEWWWGDCDWAANVEQAGYRLGQVTNAHFLHLNGGSVSMRDSAATIDFNGRIQRDYERFRQKWPIIPKGERAIPLELL